MSSHGHRPAPWTKSLLVVAFLAVFAILGAWGGASGAVVLAAAVILGGVLMPFVVLYFLVRFVKWSWTRP